MININWNIVKDNKNSFVYNKAKFKSKFASRH
jgi:hypothetical protein